MAKSAKRKAVKSVKRGTRAKRREDAAFEIMRVSNPLERDSFGAVGAFFEVRAAREFTNELLTIPYQRAAARLVEESTLRLFWWDAKARSFVLVDPSDVDVLTYPNSTFPSSSFSTWFRRGASLALIRNLRRRSVRCRQMNVPGFSIR